MSKMRNYFLFLILISTLSFSQTDSTFVLKGKVIDEFYKKSIPNTTIINKNTSLTSTSDKEGNFEIEAKKNDIILLAHIAYKVKYIEIKENKFITIFLTEYTKPIEEIIVTNYQLTGYLEIDYKHLASNDNSRYEIAGLNLGYEAGNKAPKAFKNLLNALSDPVDLVYNLFNKKEKDLKKLIALKKDPQFNKLLSSQNNRESLAMILNINKDEIGKILEKCNYSKTFIQTASDLQVLDAICDSYEDYKVYRK